MGNLTARQEKFVLEYIRCGNGKSAAIAAGYSPKAAEQQGSELLKNPKVSEVLRKKQMAMLERLEISVERVLKERARMAFFDVGDLAAYKITEPADIAKLPHDLRQAITGWKYDRQGRFMVQLADKNAHLTALEKHLGMYEDSEKSSPLNIHIHL